MKTIEFLLIDDDETQCELIRGIIKDHLGLTTVKKAKSVEREFHINTYRGNDDINVRIIEVYEPSVKVLDLIFEKYCKNLAIVIFDMIWSKEEKQDFYDNHMSLFYLPFEEMFSKIHEIFKSRNTELPGGLKFLYKWIHNWRYNFDLTPMVVSKSNYFTDDLKTALDKFKTIEDYLTTNGGSKTDASVLLRKIMDKYDRQVKIYEGEQKLALRRKDDLIITPSVREELLLAANSMSSIILVGEEGTGKKTLAKFIHQNSPIKDQGLINIDCGAIYSDSTLNFNKGLKDILFNSGDLECGTIFLEKINEMDIKHQQQLLSGLDDGDGIKIDLGHKKYKTIRIIASVNEGITNEASNKLLTGLSYRLFNIKIPSLREQKENIIPLADKFITLYKLQYNKQLARLDETARAAIASYDWKGNIKELESKIRRAIVLLKSDEELIKTYHLELEHSDFDDYIISGEKLELKDEKDKKMIEEAIKKHGRNITLIARTTGYRRPTIYRKLKKYGL